MIQKHTHITKIKKYTDERHDGSKKSIKKNTLGEIDKALASCTDLTSFFTQYIDSDLFSYQGYNLHKMFIGYKHREKIYSLDYIMNNPELVKRLNFLKGSKIYDYDGIKDMMELIQTSDKNSFLKFIAKELREKRTNLSEQTMNLAGLYRTANDHMESSTEIAEIRNDLEVRLTLYKEYREMFLLQQHYQDDLKAKKEELEQARLRALEAQEKERIAKQRETAFRFDAPLPEYQQLTFDGIEAAPAKAKRFDSKK